MGTKVDAKVVLLGQADVGKTCLLERYLQGKFTENQQSTVGAAFGARKVSVQGKSVILGIWDTAGSERYESMSKIYYRGAWACLICYDITDKETWLKVRFWVKEVQDHEPNCKIFLIGTKLDLIQTGAKQRAISEDEVNNYVRGTNLDYWIETSSKTAQNVDDAFTEVARQFLSSKHTLEEEKIKLSNKTDQSQQPPCQC